MSEIKTNPMRHLDKLGIPYKVHLFTADTGERIYFGKQKPLGEAEKA